jgi:hypothetical protein
MAAMIDDYTVRRDMQDAGRRNMFAKAAAEVVASPACADRRAAMHARLFALIHSLVLPHPNASSSSLAAVSSSSSLSLAAADSSGKGNGGGGGGGVGGDGGGGGGGGGGVGGGSGGGGHEGRSSVVHVRLHSRLDVFNVYERCGLLQVHTGALLRTLDRQEKEVGSECSWDILSCRSFARTKLTLVHYGTPFLQAYRANKQMKAYIVECEGMALPPPMPRRLTGGDGTNGGVGGIGGVGGGGVGGVDGGGVGGGGVGGGGGGDVSSSHRKFWKLDATEASNRTRTLLRRNLHGSTHEQASHQVGIFYFFSSLHPLVITLF